MRALRRHLFISNAFVPIEATPAWMAPLARLNPLSYAIAGMRILVLEGWTQLPLTLAVLALSAVVLLACGTYEFRRHTGGRVG